jgi:7-keto-8-aminopelargonate synthetase-like enzyme
MSSKPIKKGDLLNQVLEWAKERNLVFTNTEDETLNGRTITNEGKELVNFGSCSVLGLEKHPALIVGLDYRVLRCHEVYQQVLYRTVWQAW